MTGEVAQLCWLASFGTNLLRGTFDPAELSQLSFKRTRYLSISTSLYAAVTDAIVAGLNAEDRRR